MKKIIALVLVLTMVLSMTACGGKKDTYELRCSTNLAATSTVGQGLAKFVELVNESPAARSMLPLTSAPSWVTRLSRLLWQNPATWKWSLLLPAPAPVSTKALSS